jgi:hypothetical protein
VKRPEAELVSGPGYLAIPVGSKTMDRKAAAQLMRYMSATDIVLGGLLETLQGNPELDPDRAMTSEVFRAVDILHRAVRHPVIVEYPDLDYDNP